MALTIDNLRIGMRVSHPRYGIGVVKALTQHTADISFDDAPRTLDPSGSGLVPAEPSATLRELYVPLSSLIRDVAQTVVDALGFEKEGEGICAEGVRWMLDLAEV